MISFLRTYVSITGIGDEMNTTQPISTFEFRFDDTQPSSM